MDKKSSAALLAGRLGIGLIFLVSGLGKLASWQGTVAFASAKGVPVIPLAGATALEILGALSLLVGWKTRWGVAALVVFLVPVTLVFHAFWAYQGAEAQLQAVHFLKNVAIGGGLLTVLGAGPGAFSADARRSRRAAKPVTHAPEAEAVAPGSKRGREPWNGASVKSSIARVDTPGATSSTIPSGEIAVFEPSEASIGFVAEGKTGFVLGSAAKHPHELVLGNYSP